MGRIILYITIVASLEERLPLTWITPFELDVALKYKCQLVWKDSQYVFDDLKINSQETERYNKANQNARLTPRKAENVKRDVDVYYSHTENIRR